MSQGSRVPTPHPGWSHCCGRFWVHEEVSVSHSVRSTAETRRACGGVTVQAAQWSREEGGHLQRAAGSVTEAAGEGTEPEDKCFSIRVYSWWRCTTEWAPQSGREGRRCGPGWPDCTWARTERCTAPKQTCGEKTQVRARAWQVRWSQILTSRCCIKRPNILLNLPQALYCAPAFHAPSSFLACQSQRAATGHTGTHISCKYTSKTSPALWRLSI